MWEELAKPDVLGAIYRVRKTGAPKVEDPWGLKLAWADGAQAQIVDRLGDARPAVRARAIGQLAAQGTNAVPLLAAQLKSPSVPVRRAALWTLSRIGDPAARLAARVSLNDPDDRVLHTALKAVSNLRDRVVLSKLVGLLAETNAPVLRAVVEGFGRTAGKEMGMMLFNVTQREDARPGGLDPTLEHSVIAALTELADPVMRKLEIEVALTFDKHFEQAGFLKKP